MLSGSLTYKDYDDLYNKGQIINPYFLKSQIQPSSVDLTLSEECYEINVSFLIFRFLISKEELANKITIKYGNL